MSLAQDYCKFCYSNGEAAIQFRSHRLKNEWGSVVCPILRSHVCVLCSGTGDFAHTIRYCPLNIDGRYSRGASLTELKRKKNAAGNLPTRKKLTVSMPSRMSRSNSEGADCYLPPSPPTTAACGINERYFVTDPLPSRCRLFALPEGQEMLRQKHIMEASYHRSRAKYHEDQYNKINWRYPSPPESKPCFVRNFSLPMMTPPSSPRQRTFHENYATERIGVKNVGYNVTNRINERFNVFKTESDVDELGILLANLREGTEALDE